MSQSPEESRLSDEELRQIAFRLLLTPKERLELLEAILRENELKRSISRQVANHPTSAELRGPDNPRDYAIWIANGRNFSVEDARRAATSR